MTSFVIYTIVLLLLAFLLGAAIGCMFRRWWMQEETATGDYLKPDRVAPPESGRATASDETDLAAAAIPKPASGAQTQPASVQLFASEETGEETADVASVSAEAEPATPTTPTRTTKSRARKPAAAKPRAKPKTGTATKPKAQAAAKTKARTAAKTKTAARTAGADDLKKLKGVGQKIEAQLHEAGIKSFAQIAGWTKKDIDSFDNELKFRGRIERDDWVGQAKVLAAGEDTDFSKRVAGGEVPSSAAEGRGKGARTRKTT